MLGFSALGQVALGQSATTTANSYTLSASAGSFAVTGQDATPKRAALVLGAAGSFVLTGSNALLVQSKRIAAGTGDYTVAVSPAVLTSRKRLSAAVGDYTLAGKAAAFKFAGTLSGFYGAFTLSGQPASILSARVLSAAAGAIVGGYQSATLTKRITLSALSGQLKLNSTVPAETGGMLGFGALADGPLAGSQGAAPGYAALLYDRLLSAVSGATLVSGQASSLVSARFLQASQASYALTGYDVTEGLRLFAWAGQFSLTGRTATLKYAAPSYACFTWSQSATASASMSAQALAQVTLAAAKASASWRTGSCH